MEKFGGRKYLNYQKEHDTPLESQNHIVDRVKELTGDFFSHIECQHIEDEDNAARTEVVYFGPEADLAPGGVAENIYRLAISEVYLYKNPLERAWVSWNNEAECRKGLDPEKNQMGFFHGPSLEPKFYEVGDSWPNYDSLNIELAMRMMLVQPKWN